MERIFQFFKGSPPILTGIMPYIVGLSKHMLQKEKMLLPFIYLEHKNTWDVFEFEIQTRNSLLEAIKHVEKCNPQSIIIVGSASLESKNAIIIFSTSGNSLNEIISIPWKKTFWGKVVFEETKNNTSICTGDWLLDYSAILNNINVY